jgi:predicted nucleic acid-binding protein
MDVPGVVVVDTSAAVEALVAEAKCHGAYAELFAAIRRSGAVVAYSELLEPELVEAAYTWDLRRQHPRDWRARRRAQTLSRVEERERRILRTWRQLAGEQRSVVVPIRSVVDASVAFVTNHGLGSYDAVHVATAHHLEAPILTHDRLMIRAATTHIDVITLREGSS